jgi:hypothetical protein
MVSSFKNKIGVLDFTCLNIIFLGSRFKTASTFQSAKFISDQFHGTH